MELVFCVANFAYNMFVCGKVNDFGCSGEIVAEDSITEVNSAGKLYYG